ncbi:MAG: tail fiber protein [Methylobacterium sp.]
MSDSFIGTIQAFGFNFAPSGWAQCNGQSLSIQQNTALFSLLGTTYGGNGQSTFALPNLQGRTMVHVGTGPNISPRSLGQTGGSETASLNQNNLPAHTHALNAVNATGTSATASGNLLANATGLVPATDEAVSVTIYAPAGGATTALSQNSIGSTGNSSPFPVLSPFQVVNICICLQGIFPTRN